jgi:hypothetical protein
VRRLLGECLGVGIGVGQVGADGPAAGVLLHKSLNYSPGSILYVNLKTPPLPPSRSFHTLHGSPIIHPTHRRLPTTTSLIAAESPPHCSALLLFRPPPGGLAPQVAVLRSSAGEGTDAQHKQLPPADPHSTNCIKIGPLGQ